MTHRSPLRRADRRAGQLVTISTVLLIAVTASACSPGTSQAGVVASPAATGGRGTTAVSASVGWAPTPSASAFLSERYGYRLQIPAAWSASETPGTGGTHPDEPGVDTFNDGAGHILSIVGEPAAALAGWTCAIGQHLQGEHDLAVENVEDILVAGSPARVSDYHMTISPYVIHYLTVEVVRDGQGLTLSMESTTGRDDEDRSLLDRVLADFAWTT